NKGLKMTTNNTYNGWTNYATWRVNLEMFDAWNIKDLCNMSNSEILNADAYAVGQELQQYAEMVLNEDAPADSFALAYALAFLNDVNWTEIASSMIETYKDEYSEEEA
ncbi:DUF7249 family protein, partial [Chryseobacterium cucumeris]|uniref:DUF7249 family protein n=1 Tax=Chryseobacterium cucumeris TaxID=1813611 RepID=UPI0023F30B42